MSLLTEGVWAHKDGCAVEFAVPHAKAQAARIMKANWTFCLKFSEWGRLELRAHDS